MKKILLITLSAVFSVSAVYSQTVISKQLKWNPPINFGVEKNNNTEQTLNFSEALYDFEESKLPLCNIILENLKSYKIANAYLTNVITSELTQDELGLIQGIALTNDFDVAVRNAISKKQNFGSVLINPIRNNNGKIEKLLSFDLNYTKESASINRRSKSRNFASNSILSSGDWYKIAIVKDGVFAITPNMLTSLGIDVNEIDPRNIRIYSNSKGMLDELNSDNDVDDLKELAIKVEGESDGSFDKNDYALFYGKDQVVWTFDSVKNAFRHRLNIYSDTSFYYLNFDIGTGKRIASVDNSILQSNTQVASVNAYTYHESESVNLIKSGQIWLGEVFDNQTTYNFGFNFPSIITTEPATIQVSYYARAGLNSDFITNVNGFTFTTDVTSVVLNRYDFGFARGKSNFQTFTPTSSVVNVSVDYIKPQSVAKGWLNFITLNVRRNLVFTGGNMPFRDVKSVGVNNISEFTIQGANSAMNVWEVTDLTNIVSHKLSNNGSNIETFKTTTDVLKEFVAFDQVDSTNVSFIGKVQNQNLHALPQTDMVIVSHQLFLSQANQLANFHRSEGMTVHVVTPDQVYNEFSSGSQDPIAIRSFMKMFYDRGSVNDLPKYLLIMGDASYDPKNRISGNTNYVISYQARNSTDPVYSYVSDDYMGLLDDTEGLWKTSQSTLDYLDVGIGRLPVKTVQEANAVVNKIINYNTPNTQNEWRNKIVFVGDDEDGVTHMLQSNQLANLLENNNNEYNLNKVFLDSYQQQSTSGGHRYPQVNSAINRGVEDGALIVNYTGHGGETGWAHERILDIGMISSWNNLENLPLFVTATCEFSRFDDPLRTSGGELVLLNPNGGGVGLLTTTRLVFSSPNYRLNDAFYKNVFKRDVSGEHKRIGDVFMQVKNNQANIINSRNFSLLGDPALQLAIPQQNVVTTQINGVPIGQIDTIGALSSVTISGFVADYNGNKLGSFNGFVYPTVYDKSKEVTTLNNDNTGTFKYSTQENRIFKGKASVVNGDFTFSFVVPKDISYSFGEGKISYYAKNGVIDANGSEKAFIIGGSDGDVVDDLSPQIQLFMNDDSFVFGGVTNENPSLLAKLSDDFGINTVGNGIGHDIVAILDNNSESAIVLNDYYEAETDNPKNGTVRFPFSNLSDGVHTLTLKAWDIANNSAESTIEFNVLKSKNVELENVVNYPNPFTTNTEFIFQHNQPGIPLDVKVDVFTVSGKLVTTIEDVVVNEGYISRDLKWDGKDSFGDNIAKGVYMYKLQVRSRNGAIEEKIEKLVKL